MLNLLHTCLCDLITNNMKFPMYQKRIKKEELK